MALLQRCIKSLNSINKRNLLPGFNLESTELHDKNAISVSNQSVSQTVSANHGAKQENHAFATQQHKISRGIYNKRQQKIIHFFSKLVFL